MRLDHAAALRLAAGADHGVLATLHPERGADLVPVCFAIVGEVVAVPIDRVKPKSGTTLERLRNLAADPRATLLLEHWDPDDWSTLWWVRLSLRRSSETPDVQAALAAALIERYPQYAAAPFSEILVFRIRAVTGWAAE
jgi:PPOX class probable F420-dependent enzyme